MNAWAIAGFMFGTALFLALALGARMLIDWWERRR